MKKAFVFCMILVMCVLVSGCGKNDNKSTDSAIDKSEKINSMVSETINEASSLTDADNSLSDNDALTSKLQETNSSDSKVKDNSNAASSNKNNTTASLDTVTSSASSKTQSTDEKYDVIYESDGAIILPPDVFDDSL